MDFTRIRERTVMKNSPKLGPLFQIGLVSFVWLVLAIILPTTNGGPAHLSRNVPCTHPSGSKFVFADLDGDRKPDLALVEMQSGRSVGNNYSIRLSLSAGTESAIGVTAPTGGLQVAARDVNGDESLDLIVTSNLDARFVEVLLNDGSGNFSVAAPGDFSFLENPFDSALNVPLDPQANRVTIATIRTSYDEGIAQKFESYLVFSVDRLHQEEVERAEKRTGLSSLGRSPPSPVVPS
jgi:hypothetical protein